MKKLFAAGAILAACLLTSACADPDAASRRALGAMGMTDVRTSRTWFNLGCSKGDDWARDFTATGPNGQLVSGTVCGGWIGKGATVRFD